MNFSGRLIGGTLIAIGIAWILTTAGALPFSNRSNNQIAGEGASNNRNAPTANNQQNRPGTQNFGTGNQGNGSIAQQPTTSTSPYGMGSDGTVPVNPNVTPPTAPEAPVVRGAW